MTDTSLPVTQEYLKALKTAAPDAKPTYPGFEGFVNAKVLAEGLKRADKNLTADGLIKALESIQSGKEALGLNLVYGAQDHEGDLASARFTGSSWPPQRTLAMRSSDPRACPCSAGALRRWGRFLSEACCTRSGDRAGATADRLDAAPAATRPVSGPKGDRT